MKKPKVQVDDTPPIKKRADLAPTIGYAIVVDGRFKTEFSDRKAAEKSATKLLGKYPRLKIEIYDASSKSRTPVK
jgi:hypothetical protein